MAIFGHRVLSLQFYWLRGMFGHPNHQTCTESNLLDKWHDLVVYTLSYLNPSTTNHYLKTWRRIFDSSKCKSDFTNISLLIEISFCLPVTTAKLERSFSMLNRVKTDTWAAMGIDCVENLLRIGQEGPPLSSFHPLPAMDHWFGKKVRRPNQRKKRFYKLRKSDVIQEKDWFSSSSSSESDEWRNILTLFTSSVWFSSVWYFFVRRFQIMFTLCG